MSDLRLVPFDAKPGFWSVAGSTLKRAFWNNRYAETVRWWVSQRRVRKYQLHLQSQMIRFDRRLFIKGLILAPFTPVPKIPKDIQQAIVSEYLKTAAGRQKLAASMIFPLQRRIDYAGLSRRIFMVEQIPQGAAPVYDRDPDVAGIVAPAEDEAT